MKNKQSKPTAEDVFHALIKTIKESLGEDAVPIMLGLWDSLDAMFPPDDGAVSGDLHQDWRDISIHATAFQHLAALGESGFARLASEREEVGDAYNAFIAYTVSYYFGQLVRAHKRLPVSTQAEIQAAFDKEAHRLGMTVTHVDTLAFAQEFAQKHT